MKSTARDRQRRSWARSGGHEYPREQFQEIVRVLHFDTQRFTFTRCIRCNVELERVIDPETIRARVEPAVFAARREFFTCPRCATVFWHGSHVENTCRKLFLLLR